MFAFFCPRTLPYERPPCLLPLSFEQSVVGRESSVSDLPTAFLAAKFGPSLVLRLGRLNLQSYVATKVGEETILPKLFVRFPLADSTFGPSPGLV